LCLSLSLTSTSLFELGFKLKYLIEEGGDFHFLVQVEERVLVLELELDFHFLVQVLIFNLSTRC